MRTIAASVLVVMALGPVRAARAQAYVEAGASIGQACLMGEASCADEVVSRGWQAGVWLDERRVVRVRYLLAPRPDRSIGEGLRWTGRARSLWLGEMTWHWGAPRAARLYAGFSVGAQRDRFTVACEAPACDPAAAGIRIGEATPSTRLTLGGVAGVSLHPQRRLVVTAGIGAYNFPAEHAGTFVLIAQIAYRHPLRR